MIMKTISPFFKNRISKNRISKDESGLALTEFAMSLPILMMLSVSFIDLAGYINANTRVSQIALSVADNSGRVKQRIDEGDVDAIMIGSRIAGENIKFGSNGRVILSVIEVNGKTGADAGQMITWQRCFGAKNVTSSYGVENSGKDDATYAAGFGPAGNKMKASQGNGVMFVEVVYDYQPLFPVGDALVDSLRGKTIRATAAYPVRERTSNVMQNGNNLADSDPKKRLCNKFVAT
jgi:Flp pilus assembly protein TadG